MAAIRRHVYIANGARAVWRALTTAEGLEKWLAEDARVDARKGGRVVLTGSDLDSEHDVVGMIHTWRPTSKPGRSNSRRSRPRSRSTVTLPIRWSVSLI